MISDHIRHKVFISYHHDDQSAVDDFIRTFDEERDVFIARAVGTEMDQTIIDSNNTERWQNVPSGQRDCVPPVRTL